VSTLTEVIGTGVNDNSSTDDGLGAEERNVLVCLSADDPAKTDSGGLTRDLNRGVSGSVGLDVS
jgi:hypothetical protein